MKPSKLLLVDADPTSLRVLEVSLKKAGYTVLTAERGDDALRVAETIAPDLVLTDVKLPDRSGYALCRALRQSGTSAVVFVSSEGSDEARIEAINAGAHAFVEKPVLVKEIVAQVQAVLEKRHTESIARRERPGNLSGTLASTGVVDLLQLMETGNKSGIVHVSSDPARSGGFVAEGQERGTIFFREGEVIDARLGKLRGVEAVYRMLLWDDGVFEIEFKQISRGDAVRTSTQAILLEGMRRVDEWSHLAAELPPMNARLTVDYDALSRVFEEVPVNIRPVLHLFDSRRSLFEVVNDASMADTDVLAIISGLHHRGVLQKARLAGTTSGTISDRPGSGYTDNEDHRAVEGRRAVEGWRSEPRAGPRVNALVPATAAVPSVPTHASELALTTQIPIPAGPSDTVFPGPLEKERSEKSNRAMVGASDTAFPRPLEKERSEESNRAMVGASDTAFPRPLEEDDRPPVILSRRTVAAHRPAVLSETPVTVDVPAPPPRDAPSGGPSFERFGSHPAAPLDAAHAHAVGAALDHPSAPIDRPPGRVTLQPLPGRGRRGAFVPSRAEVLPVDTPVIERSPMSPPVDAVLAHDGEDTADEDLFEPDRGDRGVRKRRMSGLVVVVVVLLVLGALLYPQLFDRSSTRGRPATGPARAAPEWSARAHRAPPETSAGAAGIQRGEATHDALRLDEARKRFAAAVATDGRNDDADSGLALVHFEQGRDHAAESIARRALEHDPTVARAHLVLALVAANARDYEEARRRYRQFLKYEPEGKHADEVRKALRALP